jgi:hypothetical protein
MKKSHVFVLAVLIAVGSALGTYALTRTTELGVQAREASSKDVDAVVATRTRQLNALEISLRKALAKKPPALPALPKKVKALPVQSSPRVYTPAPVSITPARATVTRVAAPRSSASRTSARQAPEHESDHERAPSGGEHDD